MHSILDQEVETEVQTSSMDAEPVHVTEEVGCTSAARSAPSGQAGGDT